MLTNLKRLGHHPIRLVGFTLSLLLLLLLFLLLTRGLPDPLIHRITARFHQQGIPLQIESIRLSPRGWVLHNVQIYSPFPDDLTPLFKTKKLTFFLWPDNWPALSKTGWNISLRGKNNEISPGQTQEKTLHADNPFRTIERMDLSLYIDHEHLRINESTLLWGGFRIQGSGKSFFSDQPQAFSFQKTQTQAVRIAEVLSELQFETEPEINIRFNTDGRAPEKTTLNATCFARNLQWKGKRYNRLSASLNVKDNRLSLDSLQVVQADGDQLTASGSLDLKTQTAQVSLENTLCAGDLINLLPASVHNILTRAELNLFGAARFKATLGPGPAENIFKQIHVDVQNLQIVRQDLTLDPLRAEIRRAGDRVTIDKINAAANGGTLTGRFKIDIPSLAWSSALQSSAAHPAPIGTMVGSELQSWIERFSFSEQPDICVNLSYNGTKGSFAMDGSVSAKNYSCGGERFETLEIGMAYSNLVLTLDPLRAGRGGEQFDGEVEVNFEQKRAVFSATNGFSPVTLAHVLAPDQPSILDRFAFEAPIHSAGSGQIDYGTWTNHTFSGSLRAEKVSADGLNFDTVLTDVLGLGTQLLFTNTTLEFCDGLIEGAAAFDLFQRDGSAPYRMEIAAAKVNVAKLLPQINPRDHSKTSGLLSGTFDFTADAMAGFWNSAQGGGSVNIEEGQLTHLPLVGGLTRIIQSAIPGFKLFSITTLFADYELRDTKLLSRNLQFGGTLLSAEAKGAYSPETGLNVRLRIVPLRQTREDIKWYQLHLWSAEALKKSTAPLFNLLELSLEGTLSDPQWRMVALPKEIYEIINRDKKPETPAAPPAVTPGAEDRASESTNLP